MCREPVHKSKGWITELVIPSLQCTTRNVPRSREAMRKPVFSCELGTDLFLSSTKYLPGPETLHTNNPKNCTQSTNCIWHWIFWPLHQMPTGPNQLCTNLSWPNEYSMHSTKYPAAARNGTDTCVYLSKVCILNIPGTPANALQVQRNWAETCIFIWTLHWIYHALHQIPSSFIATGN